MTDIIIIGGGMAGLTSALYSLRAGKSVTLIESESIGGQIATSPRVENFPSHKAITGSKLADETFEQVMSLGLDFELDKVVKIEKEEGVFKVTLEYGKLLTAKAVVIATGVKHKTLNLPNEKALVGKGVYYCAVCDGSFYKNEDVAVIGDGNSALQYALYLAEICKKVTLLTMFDKFFGDNHLVQKVLKTQNIEVVQNVLCEGYLLNGGVFTGLQLFNTHNKEEKSTLNAKCVFIAIGQVPNNKVFETLCDLDNLGYIIANEECLTKTEGLFVAGDCRTKALRQLTTACGDGAISSYKACKFIDLLD